MFVNFSSVPGRIFKSPEFNLLSIVREKFESEWKRKKNRVDFIQFDKREYPSTDVSQINLYKNKIEEID